MNRAQNETFTAHTNPSMTVISRPSTGVPTCQPSDRPEVGVHRQSAMDGPAQTEKKSYIPRPDTGLAWLSPSKAETTMPGSSVGTNAGSGPALGRPCPHDEAGVGGPLDHDQHTKALKNALRTLTEQTQRYAFEADYLNEESKLKAKQQSSGQPVAKCLPEEKSTLRNLALQHSIARMAQQRAFHAGRRQQALEQVRALKPQPDSQRDAGTPQSSVTPKVADLKPFSAAFTSDQQPSHSEILSGQKKAMLRRREEQAKQWTTVAPSSRSENVDQLPESTLGSDQPPKAAPPDYHTQLRLLEAQNKKRLERQGMLAAGPSLSSQSRVQQATQLPSDKSDIQKQWQAPGTSAIFQSAGLRGRCCSKCGGSMLVKQSEYGESTCAHVCPAANRHNRFYTRPPYDVRASPDLSASDDRKHASGLTTVAVSVSDFPRVRVYLDNRCVQWIAFEYIRDKVKLEYTIRCDIDSVSIDLLGGDFKVANAVYPLAHMQEQLSLPTGPDFGRMTSNNRVGWQLAELNPCLRDKPDLIQKAVECVRIAQEQSSPTTGNWGPGSIAPVDPNHTAGFAGMDMADFQLNIMLLEQQNKRRLMAARGECDQVDDQDATRRARQPSDNGTASAGQLRKDEAQNTDGDFYGEDELTLSDTSASSEEEWELDVGNESDDLGV